MSKRFLACVFGLLVLLLAVGVATAAADTPPGVQTADQSAGSGQQAAAASGATQVQPSNTNISVRVLSPGNGGDVTQTNSVASTGTASNSNSASQDASQNGAGAGGIQTSTQSADNSQLAAALAQAGQFGPTNTNLGIRVGSDGNDGSVSQTNSTSSDASSSNDNDTHQSADQSQAGTTSCGCASAPAIQTSGQAAESDQKAIALSSAEQKGAANVNLPIRVGSSGNDGSVTQTNDVSSDATAKNDNDLRQSSDQDSSGGTGASVQTADQRAANDQAAAAASSATQDKPRNTNISVRVLSPGNDGSVTQTNSVSSSAKAKNDNDTRQSIDQDPKSTDGHACGCAGPTEIQTAKQGAASKQAAVALSNAEQSGASNVNAPVRVGSSGNDGTVRQSNDVSSKAEASNDNDLTQAADQDLHGASGTGIQTAEQWAGNAQLGVAKSAAEQKGASNTNTPIRVGSPGNGGTVAQSNDVSSEAKVKNDNDTRQTIDQDSTGAKDSRECGCSGPKGIQTAKQGAWNEQAAVALSKADQDFGRSECGCHSGGNSNAPVRVGSYGNDGSVWQSNDASSEAKASNDNDTHQGIDQDLQGGSSGTSVQTADQWAGNAQLSAAASFADQSGASNRNAPVRVKSDGEGGRVAQSNSVSSEGRADNDNETRQTIDQDPKSTDGHDCGCAGPTGIQTAKQGAGSEQAAFALSKAEQAGAENKNAPVRVKSSGNDGSVWQSNDVSSDAKASNDNDTHQDVDQDLTGGSGSLGVQIAYQSAANAQLAAAASKAEQRGAKNDNSPVRVFSSGNGGSVGQSNDVSSEAKATNDNDTRQHADQDLSGRGGCGCGGSIGIQALGQKAESSQGALALSKADQDFGRSECGCHSGGNSNSPVRVWSYGNDGSVAQYNTVDSAAKADNSNATDQHGNQSLWGASGIGIQALGQQASNEQAAAAFSGAFQLGASNHNDPVRVYSSGNGGSVRQVNAVSSEAEALNRNRTRQDGSQALGGSRGCGCFTPIAVQALGQSAKSGQLALGLSAAFQLAPKNANGGSAVKSGGNAGSIGQLNDDSSFAGALNRDRAELLAGQRSS
jgi:epidermal growth factor receptor substrate 15